MYIFEAIKDEFVVVMFTFAWNLLFSAADPFSVCESAASWEKISVTMAKMMTGLTFAGLGNDDATPPAGPRRHLGLPIAFAKGVEPFSSVVRLCRAKFSRLSNWPRACITITFSPFKVQKVTTP